MSGAPSTALRQAARQPATDITLHDLAGDQGRDGPNPVLLVDILRRLFWTRRQSTRI